ncbi:S8 family serine peptidase [Spongiactinospora sp. TRM90649]|uniref:S8 family peptidase n=1 Tax=Spongiactinospora sp. TRM90649 TaxID=3031114 RepID=UPI0023F90804|nr:S8 family serine peptidase [Spongiactinospora sp. TRM90649]MDF5756397.1 S8 family serine peptidase [Spongiactinospora sp. TRM90649]
MRFRRVVVSSLLLALLPATPATAADPPAPPAPPAPTATAEAKLEQGLSVEAATKPVRVIVELREPAAGEPVALAAEQADANVLLHPPPSARPFIVVEGDGEALKNLAGDPRVLSVHRDRAYPPALAESVKVIGADRAHAEGVRGAGQTVAVLDTGVDRNHAVFAGRIVAEACFSSVSEEDLPLEPLCPNGQSTQIGQGAADANTPKCLDGGANLCDHGTHVAGIAVGGAADGGPGPGVAPEANLIAVQIFSRVNDSQYCGEPTCLLTFDSSLRLALDHIAGLTATHKIAAVNLSVGGGLSDVACDGTAEGMGLKPSIDALLAKGVPTVAAAGNESFDGAGFPGCISSAVTVGATDDTDGLAPFTNRGPLLDLFAPGVDVNSAVPGGHTSYSGTSMAAPHVAGSLALLRQRFPDATGADLVERLRSSGRGVVYGEVTTPRIDVHGALTGAAPSPPTTPEVPEPGPTNTTPEPEPQPEPTDEPAPDPTPVPLPTVDVTITVTVTVTPPSAPRPTTAPAPAVCTRGKGRTPLTAAGWAAETRKGTRKITDAALTCYLSLAGKASKVFPEVRKISTPASAGKVLRSKAKSGRAALDRELLAAWLNWAHGARNTTAKVTGSATLRAMLTTAERDRLTRGADSTRLKRDMSLLRKHVNK